MIIKPAKMFRPRKKSVKICNSTLALAATEVKDGILGKTSEEITLTLYYVEEEKSFPRRELVKIEAAKAFILKMRMKSQSDFFAAKVSFVKL